MATTDQLPSRLRGTLQSLFRILDVQWKRESAPAIGARNDGDGAYVNVRGADPASDDDLVTRRYGLPSLTTLVDGVTTTWTLTPATAHAQWTPLAAGHTLTANTTGLSDGFIVSLRIVQGATGFETIFDPAKFGGLLRGPFLEANAISQYRFQYDSGTGRLWPIGGFGWRVKIVSALPYAMVDADHCTYLVTTGAGSGDVDAVAIGGRSGFEVGVTQAGAGTVTFDPSGAEVVFYDPGSPAGSASLVFPNRLSTLTTYTDGSTGWYVR